LSPGVAKAFLANEYRKAKLAQLTHDCRHGDCTGCNVCQQLGVNVVDYTGRMPAVASSTLSASCGELLRRLQQRQQPQAATAKEVQSAMKLRLQITKDRSIRFISHLEYARYFDAGCAKGQAAGCI
jgi:hypothetical protein